ncbi:GntR family transcriptional regulator [Klenkia sp. LSe6-5]|uniref:GntR family transcriptional regulator n=1 Tax=Klenkia sesuvii TaxID=3103137 RepID=A0ABU8DYJ0_9ACTN
MTVDLQDVPGDAVAPARLITLHDIDRTSPVPLYYQVAQRFERAIEDGVITPGAQLDTEVQLAADLGLSRPTMRQAMQYLVDKGLVVRQRGKGTRVVQPKVRRSLELTSLYDDLDRTGQHPTTTVLSFSTGAPDAAVQKALQLDARDEVISVVRLRCAGGQPIARLTNHVPASRLQVTAEDFQNHGLYQMFRTAGIVLHSANQTIGAQTCTRDDAVLLDLEKGAALLTMERIAYDDHGLAVEFGQHVYVATRYSFEMSLLAT